MAGRSTTLKTGVTPKNKSANGTPPEAGVGKGRPRKDFTEEPLLEAVGEEGLGPELLPRRRGDSFWGL